MLVPKKFWFQKYFTRKKFDPIFFLVTLNEYLAFPLPDALGKVSCWVGGSNLSLLTALKPFKNFLCLVFSLFFADGARIRFF